MTYLTLTQGSRLNDIARSQLTLDRARKGQVILLVGGKNCHSSINYLNSLEGCPTLLFNGIQFFLAALIKIRGVVCFMCVDGLYLLCFLWFKGAGLQLFPDEKVIRTKKNLFEKVVTIKPRRGIIYDRYGRELALSVSSHSLFADPSLIKNAFETADRLSRLMKIPRSKYLKKDKKQKKKRFVWIKRHVLDKERGEDSVLEYSWFRVLLRSQRGVYPNETLMSQVLGFHRSEWPWFGRFGVVL